MDLPAALSTDILDIFVNPDVRKWIVQQTQAEKGGDVQGIGRGSETIRTYQDSI